MRGKMPEESNDKKTGRVRWFSSRKGYGFVNEDDSHRDIFLHYSAIQLRGYKHLSEGQRVLFTLHESKRGPVARDVLPIAEES